MDAKSQCNKCHVVVSLISGHVRELDVVEGTTVGDLRVILADVCNVPILCQRLLVDAGELIEDWESLRAFCQADTTSLAVMLLVTPTRAIESLESGITPNQALCDLAQLGLKLGGGNVGIKEVTKCLENEEPLTRRYAVEALGVVAEEGDMVTLERVLERLDDVIPRVRQSAIGTTALLAATDEEVAIVAVAACLADSQEEVRSAAVRALSLMATKGNAAAVAAVTLHLSSCTWYVREAAVQTLGMLACNHDAASILALCVCLLDKNSRVRDATVEAFKAMGKSEEATNMLSKLLTCEEWHVRSAAIEAFAAVARKCDSLAISLVIGCLDDEVLHVRIAALEALKELATEGDTAIADAVSKLVTQPDEYLRSVALEVLAKVLKEDEFERQMTMMQTTGGNSKYGAKKIEPDVSKEQKQWYVVEKYEKLSFVSEQCPVPCPAPCPAHAKTGVEVARVDRAKPAVRKAPVVATQPMKPCVQTSMAAPIACAAVISDSWFDDFFKDEEVCCTNSTVPLKLTETPVVKSAPFYETTNSLDAFLDVALTAEAKPTPACISAYPANLDLFQKVHPAPAADPFFDWPEF